MATIRLTVLNSIKESNGKLPILICISQKKDRAYIKTEFLLDDISEFEDGRVVYRKDAGIINKRIQFVFSQYKEKTLIILLEIWNSCQLHKSNM